MAAFLALVQRDIRMSFGHGGAAGLVLAFYAVVIVLFPLGVGPEPAMLARIAPAILWIAALLAALLSLDRMFQADFEDGSLDALTLGPLSPAMIALAKALAHWLALMVPLVLLSPVFALMLQLPADATGRLMLALLIGSPALSLLGAVAGALTVAMRRGGSLVALLVLPLYIPPLIFGVSAAAPEAAADMVRANLSLLGGFTLFALVLSPLAAGGALRLAQE